MTQAIERTTLRLMGAALDAAALRQRICAHNIANANTGAPVGRVVFEQALGGVRSRLASGLPIAPEQLDDARSRVVWDRTGGVRGVANLDREATQLAQNALHYQALVRTLNGYLDLRSFAVNDGKR